MDNNGCFGSNQNHQMHRKNTNMRNNMTREAMHKDISNSKEHSQTVGESGPVVMQDSVLHETLSSFVHSQGVKRVVHTKGFGAFGYFHTYQSMTKYTCASFLQNTGQQTPVLTRFSLAVSNPGTPDTSRNVRGFSTKFYTPDGAFDLLCNHIPVFLVRDAMKFPASIRSFLPSAKNNLSDPEIFWGFIAATPEATHFVTWLYSDLGTIKSLRHIRAYGVNTYVWKNENDVRHFIKYHWIPVAGEQSITKQESILLAGENPDIAGQDLYNTIAKGKNVEYELCVQIMNPKDVDTLSYDPLDDTKVWSEAQYPLIPVGRLVLNRNPDDYNSQIEKVAFSPMNLVEGVELSNDKMLQGRSTIYWDAQRYRLGPDFRKIPINHEENFTEDKLVNSGVGTYAEGYQMRSELSKPDNFTQAGEHYYALSDTQKDHLVDNIASELYSISKDTQDTVMGYFQNASPELHKRISQRMWMYENKK